jgi:hypothetical protein
MGHANIAVTFDLYATCSRALRLRPPAYFKRFSIAASRRFGGSR